MTRHSSVDSQSVGPVVAWLAANASAAALTGGYVRDLFLDRAIKDLDITTARGAVDLARALANHFGGAFYPMDEARDTGRAILPVNGQPLVVDVAAWRGATLEEDLRLRDFTVNAMAQPLLAAASELIDPVDGQRDLHDRVLRMASNHALSDDPVRVLRAIRLLAELTPWGFRLDDDTRRSAHDNAPLLTRVSAERVRDELVRILDVPQPGDWVMELDKIAAQRIVLPETTALQGVPQSSPHVWDVYRHTLAVVNHAWALGAWIEGDDEALAASSLPWVAESLAQSLAGLRGELAAHLAQGEGAQIRSRGQLLVWAALCHDWGKPATASLASGPGEPDRWRFIGHPEAGADLAYAALRRLRFNEGEARRVSLVVRHHMRPLLLAVDGQPSRRATFRYFRDLGDAGVDTALLSLADQQGIYGPTLTREAWQPLLETVVWLLEGFVVRKEQLVAPPALVNGRELMAILRLPGGRRIGQLLDAIAEAQAAGEVTTREEALALARQLSDQPDRLEMQRVSP